ncbi:MAG: hypothetical protein RR359_02310 [Bacilli bacterium]
MTELTMDNLLLVDGGLKFSGSLINSFSAIIKTIYTVGQSLGTAIRRVYSNKLCSL